MKISAPYRIIASILSLSILIGVSIPSGLHAMSDELCNEMEEMHQPMSEHGEDCPMNNAIPAHDKNEMKHHDLHDFGFACACSLEEAPVKTEAQAQLKLKVPVSNIVEILAEIHIDISETHAFQIPVSDTYSSPPIYLYNESFLI